MAGGALRRARRGGWALALTLLILGGPGRPASTQAAPLAGAASARVYTTTLSIPTYNYLDALVPTNPDDAVYPYPRLNFDGLGRPRMTRYTAVVLENPYLTVTVLPALGGRVYRIRDRVTGRDLTYRNPVIKPTRWGIRGWWLATGGIEWALPTEEHGLNEWRPWTYTVERTGTSVSLVVADREDRTGLEVQVRLTLDNLHAYLQVQPRVLNATASAQTYQFWLNAMLSLNKNQVADSTRFILPAATVRVHSTGDGSLPAPGTDIPWPIYGERDLSRYGNWQGYLGFFAAPATADFVGAYDSALDQGVVRIFPRAVAPGVKFFGSRGLDPSLWTDDRSGYFELWGGVTPTFWDNATLEAGQAVEWTERWYAVSGLRGAFTEADALAAVRLEAVGAGVEIAVAPTQAWTGKVVLWVNGNRTAEWNASAWPGRPFRRTWPAAQLPVKDLGLQLLDAKGQAVARYGSVP